jgi:hypothetical protein
LEKKGVSLEEIQYYNSKKIVLKRVLEEGKTRVKTGKVKMEDGELVHYIVVKKHTPGIVVEAKNNLLQTKFEDGPMRELTFGIDPSKSKSRGYSLTADEWKNRKGRIVYDNEVYYIQPGGGDAKLMIKKKSLTKKKKIKRKMSGLKL